MTDLMSHVQGPINMNFCPECGHEILKTTGTHNSCKNCKFDIQEYAASLLSLIARNGGCLTESQLMELLEFPTELPGDLSSTEDEDEV